MQEWDATILEECLLLLQENKELILACRSEEGGSAYRVDGSQAFAIPKDHKGKSLLEYEVPNWEGLTFKRLLTQGIYFYHLDPQLMRNPTPFAPSPCLTPRGENLSQWLFNLQNRYPQSYDRILKVIQDLLPVDRILFPPRHQAGFSALSLFERDYSRPIPIEHVADGVLCLLAFLSLLFGPLMNPQDAVFLIEEPENHLHPVLLEVLVELLTQEQRAEEPRSPQLFATTHSTELLNFLELEDVFLVRKMNGATQLEPADSKHKARELLSRCELSVSDLVYSGALDEDSLPAR